MLDRPLGRTMAQARESMGWMRVRMEESEHEAKRIILRLGEGRGSSELLTAPHVLFLVMTLTFVSENLLCLLKAMPSSSNWCTQGSWAWYGRMKSLRNLLVTRYLITSITNSAA